MQQSAYENQDEIRSRNSSLRRLTISRAPTGHRTDLAVGRQRGQAAGDEADGGDAGGTDRHRLVAHPRVRGGDVAGGRRVGRRQVQVAGGEGDRDSGTACDSVTVDQGLDVG